MLTRSEGLAASAGAIQRVLIESGYTVEETPMAGAVVRCASWPSSATRWRCSAS